MPSSEECSRLEKQLQDNKAASDERHRQTVSFIEEVKREADERYAYFIESQNQHAAVIEAQTASIQDLVDILTTTRNVGKFVRWIGGIALVLIGLVTWVGEYWK